MCLYPGNHKKILWTWENTRHLCKGQMPLCHFPNCTQILHVSSGSLGAWERLEAAETILATQEGRWYQRASTPAPALPLPECLDHQCTSPSPLPAGLMHTGTIPDHILSHMQNQEPGGFRQPLSIWQSRGCAVVCSHSVICSFSLSSDADNLSLYHWYDIVILGVLMRSNQSTVQCTASARWWMTAEV